MYFRGLISIALGRSSEPPGMGESRYVHALPVAVEYGDLELTITPTAVEAERGLVLIDVEPEGIVGTLEVHLSDLGYGLEDVWLVTLTHHHEDHIGGIEEVRARADPIVAVYPEETAFLTGEREPQKGNPGASYLDCRRDSSAASPVSESSVEGE
jgi:glyoxylase-like metal-dependent hydrolase (beta-lactamase superfamily II)